MRKLKNYTLEPGLSTGSLLSYRDRHGTYTAELGARFRDEFAVFREREYTYVRRWNKRRAYLRIERVLGDKAKGSLLAPGVEAVEDVLGEKGLGLSPLSMAKRLEQALASIRQSFAERQARRR